MPRVKGDNSERASSLLFTNATYLVPHVKDAQWCFRMWGHLKQIGTVS